MLGVNHMPEPTLPEISVRDPLSQVTRNERRFLLGVSMVGITLVKTGLVPSRISALGIEFTKTDQKSLLFIVALITAYFVVAFTIYAVSDFIAWRLVYRAALREAIAQSDKRIAQKRKELLDQFKEERLSMSSMPRGRIIFILSKPVSLIRTVFEFVLPILIGIYAILTVLLASVP